MMAKSLHVKANKPWKRITIPQSGFDNNIFDGLVDLKELTDYEFTKRDPSASKKQRKRPASEEADHKSSGGKKKKTEEHTEVNTKSHQENKDHNDNQSQNKLKKKKKGKSRKKKTEQEKVDKSSINVEGSSLSNVSESTSTPETVQKTEDRNEKKSNRKKGKSRKKKNANVSDNDNGKKDNMSINRETDIVSEKSEPVKPGKNKKRKRKKKNSAKNSEVSPVQIDSSNLEENVNKNEDLDMSKWSNLFVPQHLLRSLQEQGFQNPTTIQTFTLPSAIRDFQDILAAAETGSGKTLAFGIPILSKVLNRQEQQDCSKQLTDNESLDEEESETEDGSEEAANEMDVDEESEDDDEEAVSAKLLDVDSGGDDVDNDDDDDDNDDFDFDSAIGNSSQHQSDEGFQEADEDGDSESQIVNPPQVLILEPTRELAVQVHNHLKKLAKYTDINFATVVGGMSVDKQRRLLKRSPEVIIATPGRLWQLIEEGDEHLSQVDLIHSLVVDEADRMVERGHYEELTQLLEMINTSSRRDMKRQSFVMSATLTMQVSVPKRLLNKKKEKDLEKDKLKNLTKKICLGTKPKVFDLTPKDKTAQSLTEMRINCSKDEKDYYLYYFLTQHPGRTLVFANSKDCLRRLVSILNLLECSPYPLHADMQQRQRLKNLDRFSGNDKGLLLASDVAARGLDIPNVDYVIHYQVPNTKENYVHRSGRTARASNVGLSMMLVAPEDARNYNKIVQGVKNGEELPLLPIDTDLLPAVKSRVNLARSVDLAEHRNKKIKLHNDFFTKAAEEMDMIVDEKDLVPTEDAVIQSEEKNRLKGMKLQLSSMLKGSLAPLRMTKYPTKSGKLLSMKSVDLLKAK